MKTKYVDIETGEIFAHPIKCMKGNDFTLFGHPLRKMQKLVYKWRTRLALEARSTQTLFVTFTYNDSNMPADGRPSLRDWQLFIKNLRRQLDYYKINQRVKYFVVSEYGEKTGRLHLHALIFGMPYTNLTEKLLIKTWKKGFIKVKPLKDGGVGYVLKYMTKHIYEPHLKAQSQGIGVLQTVKYHDYLLEHRTNEIHLGGYTYFLGSFLMKKILTPEEWQHYHDTRMDTVRELSYLREKEADEAGEEYYMAPFTDDNGRDIDVELDEIDLIPVHRVSKTAFRRAEDYELCKHRYRELVMNSVFAMSAEQQDLPLEYFS